MRTIWFRVVLAIALWSMNSLHPLSSARASDAPTAGMPPALSEIRAFRGRIEYTAKRDGPNQAPAISGTLVVTDGSWSLDESTSTYTLHADPGGSYVSDNGDPMSVTDLFEADPLANAWAAAVANLNAATVQLAAGGHVWNASDGIRAYFDDTGARLVALADSRGPNQIGFVFDDWTQSGVLAVPRHILRLRAGSPDASYLISNYSVSEAALPDLGRKRSAAPVFRSRTIADAPGFVFLPAWTDRFGRSPFTLAAVIAALLLVALFAVAWTRRDALILAWCRRLARDARGWRRAGVSLFVGPDGALLLDGMKYRVGPHFYNRASLVQCSSLFVRVSAPGVAHSVILPRKFRPVDLGISPTARGFTLIETLVATALFAAIVVLGIYPALIALSRADALALERSYAVVIATNALADEETANAYGSALASGSSTTVVDGMTLTVMLSPGSSRYTEKLDITVTDSRGNSLVNVATLLGPPVKPPPHSSGGPPGG